MALPASPSDSTDTSTSPLRMLLGVFVVFTLVAAVPLFLMRRAAGEASPAHITLLYGAAIWIIWLLAAPVILRLGRRFAFAPGQRVQSFVVHALLVLLLHALAGWLQIVVAIALFATGPEEPVTLTFVLRNLSNSTRISLTLLVYAGIIGIDRALRTARALRERELQATRLESQATQARLDALAARLEPHFLFNALQSVSALIDSDPPRARTMLAQIGDLLRDALAAPDAGDVTLRDEMVLLGRYLAIEETRFADRLQVELQVSPEAEQVRVPRFVLQPIAENALRHGLAPLPAGGRLRITATRTATRLRLVVWNDGVPLSSAMRDGLGLSTTRERLATRYGDSASLVLRSAADGGVETVIEVPA